jgi:hypothetical protein
MSGFFWLASYPKSGNTWTRSFLVNLLYPKEDSIDINHLAIGALASSREWIEEGLGIDISELDHDEIDRLRPLAYHKLTEDIKDSRDTYHKIHDAYTHLGNGKPMIPKTATQGVVYLVRNPLDVVVSYANHASISIAKSVEVVCDPKMAMCKTKKAQANQLRQILSTWSDHVQGWIDADLPKIVMRYEDIKTSPVAAFTRITHFLQIDRSRNDIEIAVSKSRFENLRQQEDDNGFHEKASKVKHFFRKGIVGDWQNTLTAQQIAKVITVNRPSMERLGYLDSAGNPIVQPLEFK